MPSWNLSRRAFSQQYAARLLELQSEAPEVIKKQHVVSQALLKRFAGQDINGGPILVPFDLQHGRELKQKGTAGCAWIPNFISYAPKSAEELWQTVENKLGGAIDMIEQGRLDLNTTKTITDAMALHLTRSVRYKEIHEDIATRVPDEIRNRVLREHYRSLQALYTKRNGSPPEGPRDLINLADELVRELSVGVRDGSDLRVRIEETFEIAKGILKGQALEIWTAPPGSELLISDVPAITMQYSPDRSRVRVNVPIGDSHAVAMPLSRTTLACIGRRKKKATFTPEAVDFFNRTQIQNATRFVYYHPDRRLKNFVSAAQSTRKPAN